LVKNVLVAYATRAGSTREIAESIGKILTESGIEADVLPVKKVRSIEEYDAVVLGTAVRFGMLMPEMVRFVRRKKTALSMCPVAAFVVCLTMKKETPEHHIKAEFFLDPIKREIMLISEGLFAGTMDYSKLGFVAKFIVRKMVQSPEGNFTDSQKIEEWAQELTEHLLLDRTCETVIEKATVARA
jgi:menaquinone-dependent protoporphyrinogen oxidase